MSWLVAYDDGTWKIARLGGKAWDPPSTDDDYIRAEAVGGREVWSVRAKCSDDRFRAYLCDSFATAMIIYRALKVFKAEEAARYVRALY